MKNIIKKGIIILLVVYILFLCSCDSIENSLYQEPNVEILSQKLTTKEVAMVDNKYSGYFFIPFYISANEIAISSLNQNKKKYVYSKEFIGDNILDLEFEDIQISFFSKNNNEVYIIEAKIKVSAKSNWDSNIKERKINKIFFSIFDKEVEVPVDITIENPQLCEFDMLCDSPIVQDDTYSENNGSTKINNTNKFCVWFYFEPKGWGGDVFDENDLSYVEIKSVSSLNNNLKIEKIGVIDFADINLENPEEHFIEDMNNVNLKYGCTRPCSFFAYIYVSSEWSYASDSILFTYQINGSGEIRTINVSTLIVDDHYSLIDNYES